MDFEYSCEQSLLWDSVRKLMQRVATPEYLPRFDRERLYPYELYDAWVDAGLFALPSRIRGWCSGGPQHDRFA
jgi:alkylation response protein AidB-like acyl-CoA dehydrogenase